MRTGIAIVIVTSALLAAGSALAGEAVAAPPAQTDSSQIVCRQMDPPTGTRLGGRRVCKTEGEWERDRQQAQDDLSKTQIQRGVNGNGN